MNFDIANMLGYLSNKQKNKLKQAKSKPIFSITGGIQSSIQSKNK